MMEWEEEGNKSEELEEKIKNEESKWKEILQEAKSRIKNAEKNKYVAEANERQAWKQKRGAVDSREKEEAEQTIVSSNKAKKDAESKIKEFKSELKRIEGIREKLDKERLDIHLDLQLSLSQKVREELITNLRNTLGEKLGIHRVESKRNFGEFWLIMKEAALIDIGKYKWFEKFFKQMNATDCIREIRKTEETLIEKYDTAIVDEIWQNFLEERTEDSASKGSDWTESQRSARAPIAGPPMPSAIMEETNRQGQQITKESGAEQFLENYKMSADPRGICVIINNVKFQGRLEDRSGSDIDARNLGTVFGRYRFTIRQYDNLPADGINDTLKSFAYQTDHSKYDCFVCCILSHGKEDHVYGTDCETVPIRVLTSHFKGFNCKSLREKPKLFFIQACQGKGKQGGFRRDGDGNISNTLPDESDFFLGYATVPGFVSYRNQYRGSWYITSLCEALEKYADKFHLMDIMVKVNSEVAQCSASTSDAVYKQIPAPMMTLRKRLFFRP